MKWNPRPDRNVRYGAAALAGICLTFGQFALAQQGTVKGTPLDTLMQTRLWADVPEAKDFVREARPSPDSLAYQPLTGSDPDRPKLRTKAELQALQAELEHASADNERNARKRLGYKKPATARTSRSSN